LTKNFGDAYYQIYACFEQKTAFVMQNFRKLGTIGGGVTTNLPKGTSLADFTRFEPLYSCRSVHTLV